MAERTTASGARLQLSDKGLEAFVLIGIPPEVLWVEANPVFACPAHREVCRLAWFAHHFCVTQRVPFWAHVANDAAPQLNNDPVTRLDFRTY